ncbi:MAG: 4-hydroxy-3-methylbut-2-en-1-yl diphosphate synthase [Ignavibacteriae bacterium]|nr:MAG: 4-hydroxy-3-methylbut-2-en-1-yl diphosphate synthase [Ignavibacteriota bacterium]
MHTDLTTYKRYNNSLTKYSRYKTRVVNIGDVPLGGDYPIRVQSMTTTDTMNTLATVEQSIRMIEAGSEYVRITAPALKEAVNLEHIKNELRRRGYKTPLIADIHFTPNAAEHAARVVEKVRVNPGNYADRKRFKIFQYTDEMYEQELERIRERFMPLVKICKEYGTAMRIGTNHGSLSDRIMNRYGDTPLGMVESALEFVRICEETGYHDIVLSMKASNPQVMVQAYRLLVNKMEEEKMNYPIHLGVTEAGDGEDGRIKSSVGIGTLLEDGIGDTIRVSLTEEPEAEIPVAINLVKRYTGREEHAEIPHIINYPIDPFEYKRRETNEVDKIGRKNVPVVIISADAEKIISPLSLAGAGYTYYPEYDKWNIGDAAPDFIYLGSKDIEYNLPGTLKKIFNYSYWNGLENKPESFPLFTAEEYINTKDRSDRINFVSVSIDELKNKLLDEIKADEKCMLILKTSNKHAMADLRRGFVELMNNGFNVPVVVQRKYDGLSDQELTLYAATDFGGLLVDGLGDGIWIESQYNDLSVINSISFGILQATRTRISRTEYISCPSCGRTQFDLQETTTKIRKRTDHLKGVKIGIMGCIVNGPGEMADADFGYVGSGPGKITLYKGKDVIERGIDEEIAVDRLIELIKENGMWEEKSS